MSKLLSSNRSVRTSLCAVVALLLLGVSATVLAAQDQAKPAPPTPVTTDPAARARPPLPVPANPKLPSLFLVGDSTVRNGRGDGDQGQWGWGEPLVDLFDTSKINVVNRAIGGHSSRTYYTGYWQDTLAMIKPGDFIMMQFGHNDGGPLDD